MKPRVAKALNAVTALGVSPEEAKKALKRLYCLYDKKWEFIEAENYRALIDAIFEDKAEKGTEDKGVGNCESSIVSGETSGHLQTRTHGSASKKPCLTLEAANVSGKRNRNSHREASLPMSSAVIVKSNVINLDDESGGSDSCSEKQKDHILSGTSSSSVKQDLGMAAGSICRASSVKQDRGRGRAAASGQRCSMDVASSKAGDVKLSFIYNTTIGQANTSSPYLESVLQNVEGKFLGSHPSRGPVGSLQNLLDDLCEGFSELITVSADATMRASDDVLRLTYSEGLLSPKESSTRNDGNGSKPPKRFIEDISKGKEKVKISLVDESGKGALPKFFYIPQNIVYQNAHVSVSLARISDEDSCPECSGDCLSSSVPCACAGETSGEFAYTSDGLMKEDFLNSCISCKRDPQKNHHVYCQDCPLERFKNEMMPEPCKGHLVRRFVKECWSKCGCDMQCGNRVVQRGIVRSLQVFWTHSGKGWGLRSTEDLPKGAFVCEYVGEILTNMELYERNLQNGNKRHTYPVCLDADWGSESILRDEEALCLDATVHGNVARFINHRCEDANVLDVPVEVETLDRHYYHLAFFTTRKVQAYEELTWDYLIDFNDKNHPIEAFQCCCGSPLCRGKNRRSKGKRKVSS